MNGLVKVLGLSMVVLIVGGCSLAEERRQAYLQAQPLPAMQMPAHLAPANHSNAFMLPQVGEFTPPGDTPPAYEVPAADAP